jgi:hypothetical protein
MITLTVIIYCRHYGSKDLVRDGYVPNEKQKYRYRSCKKRICENTASNGYTGENREEILKSYQERSSL